MYLDFEGLGQKDYELFLPSPVFSNDLIERTLIAGTVYSDVIHVVNKGEGLFQSEIEVVGLGLSIEQEEVCGNDVTILFHIDTRAYKPGDLLTAFLLLTYLGGEKQIDFVIKVIESTENLKEEAIESETISPIYPIKEQASYKILLNKRAYDMDETAKINITNLDIFPIAVKVVAFDKTLLVVQEHMTVNDHDFIEVRLKKSFFDRIRPKKKSMRRPIIHRNIRVEITDEKGKHIHEMPITFTNYTAPIVEGKICDDQSLRKVTVQIQKIYVRYLILRTKSLLKEALVLCEEAMAYHPTDVELKLFYLMVMIDLNMKEQVYEQVTSLMPYTQFYIEEGFEEFSDIVTALYHHLCGEETERLTASWSMTPYRQMFILHVLKKEDRRFEDFESLYLKGIRSVYIYAETVYFLNQHPMIPRRRSPYYKFVMRWALSKGWLSQTWLEKLDAGCFQLKTYDLIDVHNGYELYALLPSEGFLKLLGTLLIEANSYTSEAYGIYYEIQRRKIYLKDNLSYYIRAAFHNRLRIEIDYSQLSMLHSSLSHSELVYMYTQYRKKDTKETRGLNLIKRYYNDTVHKSIHRNTSVDERDLIAGELGDMVERYQWSEIKDLLQLPILNELSADYQELVRAVVELSVVNKEFSWLESQIPRTGIISLVSNDGLYDYFKYLISSEGPNEFTYNLALILYKSQYAQAKLLAYLAKDYRAPLKSMLDLYAALKSFDLSSVELMEKILYKGIRVRTNQEAMFKVYEHYREGEPRAEVVEAVNNFFVAQVLIEEMVGSHGLLAVLEMSLSTALDPIPIGLAILKLYQQLECDNEVISANIIKNSIKNGIIFPWFADLAVPYIKSGQFRKAVFFSYHSSSCVEVTLHYICDDQTKYNRLKMKHVAFGMYIGYFVAFYREHISYYYEEESIEGVKEITESGIYVHERLIEPENAYNSYDTINTVIMSQMMKDDTSTVEALQHHVRVRQKIKEEMVLL